MTRARYLVGIDLGTTNCAVAYVDTRGRDKPVADIKLFEVPQLVAPGETAPRAMLPSFLYLPGAHELPSDASRLPWREQSSRIVGEFARVQGARVPSRSVASAKSWLCHSGVDREADILPWGSPPEVPRLSPVEASAEYLRHLRDAWNANFAAKHPEHALERQEIVLTVPASFDEAARELTVAAARKAEFEHLTLIEEPQAAFYCWIVTHQDVWQREVRAGELILVCDVGGGTTDFSLITVVETPNGPGFRRVAVGDHLMLGGDNIDLALAHTVEAKLGGARLDAEQWSALRAACRTAKEKLLGDAPPERWPVTIAGRGARLIGGSLQSELTRDEVLGVALEGFFPRVGRDEEPTRGARGGLQEFGLPFVADPAVPRHLAAFLRKHRPAPIADPGMEAWPARPDAILYNGGALTPRVVRDRILDVVAGWFADVPASQAAAWRPRVLTNPSLDLAVAIGAAYYGVVRRGGGIRIGGGTARSFYVGFETRDASTPWLCVVPRDAQEGDQIAIADQDFELLLGQPVAFPLASSSIRPSDRPGDLVAADLESIRELPPLQTVMRVGRKAKAESVPARLEARVTEVGTIELWCQSRTDDRRWRLQIQFRGSDPSDSSRSRVSTLVGLPREDEPGLVLEQHLIDQAVEAIDAAFLSTTVAAEHGPARLIRRLEEVLELPRDRWPISTLRALWDPLRARTEQRLQSPHHELRWLSLAGYCLRPGMGAPLDETRIKSLWPVFHQAVKHSKDVQCWTEWWILWRRVAAGLNRQHHDEIHRGAAPLILPGKPGAPPRKLGRPKPEAHESSEIWRCLASLERLAASTKESLGELLIKELKRPGPGQHVLWCLGRFGGREPLYGPANTVVAAETAARWAKAILARKVAVGRETNDALFALAQLARVTGDRVRDLEPETRQEIITWMVTHGASSESTDPLRAYQERQAAEQGQALGDALPAGLRLRRAEDASSNQGA